MSQKHLHCLTGYRLAPGLVRFLIRVVPVGGELPVPLAPLSRNKITDETWSKSRLATVKEPKYIFFVFMST